MRRNHGLFSSAFVLVIIAILLIVAGPAQAATYDLVKTYPADAPLKRPYNADVDADDNIYVADFLANRIVKYDSAGNVLDAWGGDALGSLG